MLFAFHKHNHVLGGRQFNWMLNRVQPLDRFSSSLVQVSIKTNQMVICTPTSFISLPTILNNYYLSIFDSVLAIVVYINGETLPVQSYYPLNIDIFLPRLIVWRLGQCALLRCEHPSSPIWLLSKYWYILYIGELFVG